jgi:hypothetical protein
MLCGSEWRSGQNHSGDVTDMVADQIAGPGKMVIASIGSFW